MTDDRLEKVRAEIERRINELQPCNTSDNLRAHGAIAGYYQILSFINSMQEEHEFQKAGGDGMRKVINAINTNLSKEPVSNVWNDARKTIPEDSIKQIICIKEDGLAVVTIGKIVSGTVKWAYLDTLLHTSNKNLSENQCRKLIDTAFELGKEAINDKFVSEDLSEEIDYLSKRYPEVSFAKLSRIAVHVAKWQKHQIKKVMYLGEPPYLISVEQAYYRTLKLLED